MAFTVQDFQDLLRLLEQHPEWQAELRRHVLTEELLEVPSLLRRMAEAQARTDEHIASITQRLDTLTARVDAIAQQLLTLTARMGIVATRVDANTGALLERRYERCAPADPSGCRRKDRP